MGEGEQRADRRAGGEAERSAEKRAESFERRVHEIEREMEWSTSRRAVGRAPKGEDKGEPEVEAKGEEG